MHIGSQRKRSLCIITRVRLRTSDPPDPNLVENILAMCAMDRSTNQSDYPNSNAKPSRRRRKKSIVWDYFTVETVGDNCVRASCNRCKKSFAYISGSKLAGTSHLKRHITLGICPVDRQNENKKQLAPFSATPKTNIASDGNLTRKRCRAANGMIRPSLDGDNGHALTKMIILHDYPLHMVEDSGFIDFVRTLKPQFNPISASTVQEQIMGLYLREKEKLLDLLSGISGHISLTMTVWTSSQSLTYALITGHFLDQNSKLRRRSFNFSTIESPNSDTAFSHAIAACLNDWNSVGKLLAVSIDDSCTNVNSIENVRNLLSLKNSLILNGQLLIKDCYACVLSNLAVDALGYLRGTIDKVRHGVKYVKTSKPHEEMFIKLKQKLQVPSTKNLVIDDPAKWDTTYLMLVAACELKEVFSCLDTTDPDYKSILLMEEWKEVETLSAYLKLFYDAANILTLPEYPTTNVFFHEVWKIHHELMNAAVSSDPFVCNLTKPLLQRFTKYWEGCKEVLAVAVAVDPRFKMKLVEFSFSKIYGEVSKPWIDIIDESLRDLYLEYVVQALPPPTIIEENDPLVKIELPSVDDVVSKGDSVHDFDIYISDITVGQQLKLELDLYLEEPLLPRTQDFDILGWWRINRSKFPTLSKLAFDVLSIPISTRFGESVFDTRVRQVDSYRSSLNPSLLQALICSKDWLQQDSSDIPLRMPYGIFPDPLKIEM